MAHIQGSEQYQFTSEILASYLNLDVGLIKQLGLRYYVEELMVRIANDSMLPEDIQSTIEKFVRQYENAIAKIAPKWDVEIWLGNVGMESDEIELTNGVFLRRPRMEQLALVEQRDLYVPEISRISGRALPAAAILSFSIHAERGTSIYAQEILVEIENWLNILRLFKPSSVYVVYQSISTDNIFEKGFSENKDPLHDKSWVGKVEHKDISNYKLYIKKSEEEDRKRFISNIKDSIWQISPKTYLAGNPYELALHRYCDALLKSEVNAYKILSTISGLEALFSNETTEISFKMRLRIALILQYYGFDPLTVFQDVKDAYSLRSKLVHGSKTTEGKKDLLSFAMDRTHEIVNYLRVCLVIFLQLKNVKGKDDLIKIIDYSFIDSMSKNELALILGKTSLVPIPNPFLTNKDLSNHSYC